MNFYNPYVARLILVICVLIAQLVAIVVFATPTPKFGSDLTLSNPDPKELPFYSCSASPQYGSWLTANHPDYPAWLKVWWSGGWQEGTSQVPFHPNWTSIVVDFKPLIKKLPHGRYEITFSSDIMKDVP